MNSHNLRVKNWAHLGAMAGVVLTLAASGFSQIDTAKIPITVNVAATVSALPAVYNSTAGYAKTRSVKADKSGSSFKIDTLTVILNQPAPPELTAVDKGGSGNSAISRRHAGQTAPVAVNARNVRGGIQLKLGAELYGSADISLFSVDGRRVLRGKADAEGGAFNLSRNNVAAGVYLLSVKGNDGRQNAAPTFSTKLTHSGGKFSVNTVFDGAPLSPMTPMGKSAKSAADYGTWELIVRSGGYADTVITFEPVKGRNPLMTVTMRKLSANDNLGIGAVGCTREGLENATRYYIAAVRAANHTLMPLKQGAKYIENDNQASMGRNREVAFGSGLWATPLSPDYYLNFFDVDSCASFSELTFWKDDPQYINTVRLKVSGNEITEVFATVTKSGDWLFDAGNYVRYSSQEDWTELPASQRAPRDHLLKGAEDYFRYFNDKSVDMSQWWGVPCARLEGGAYTGGGSSSTCDVGIPNTQKISTIWSLVDVNYGMSVLYLFFGGADTHMFRILPNHGYRYVHTLTAMKQSDFQGAPPEGVAP